MSNAADRACNFNDTTNWFVVAPFIHSKDDFWLTRFVPDAGEAMRFTVVPARYQHDRSRKATGIAQWTDYLLHASAAWRQVEQSDRPAGLLTCFPQLALMTSLRKRLARARTPLVAWNFNLGALPGGMRRHLARSALNTTDRFIVHSRAEVHAYSGWLGLPAERFEFVPLQRAVRPIEVVEDTAAPFVLSMGSAHRDYGLLLAVLGDLGLPAVVVAARHAVEGLNVPANVTVRSGLEVEECHALVQRARLSVIPVANDDTASGQVTLLDAMMYGRPVIVTRGPASDDYVTHRSNGILVDRGDREQMKVALGELWEDAALRETLGRAARATAVERFSDEAIGKRMGEILRDVVQQAS